MTLKITGSLNYNQKAGSIKDSFRDGYGCPADGSHAVFPIIQMRDDAPWSPIATGFFISNNGLFATAKHVITDSTTGKLLNSLAGVQLIPSENRIVIREAIKIVTHDKADVAVGFLVDKNFQERGNQTINKFFSITASIPAIGCKVATFAFPKGFSIGTTKEFLMKFQLSSVVGQLEEYHPEGRDRVMLPSRCFRTSMEIEGGTSGGPVAAMSGQVFGINSTGLNGMAVSFISSVKDLLDLYVYNIRLPNGQVFESLSVGELAAYNLIMLQELS